ncbi:glutaredoxin 3 [Bombella sp. TMW 2.2559]|uniref:Glutaredoxin n=1 Tax=Bombella dulcis TaxID=2967339 RepID=A0ABT3WDL9_9PROT|nr:glutaredoxin 3 [Bombella dulcis]MCX5615884.1 glutaredoxin 3 [Bombella dulcis]
MSKVEIYTQPGCPYCVRAITLLQSKDVPFEEIHAPRGSVERETARERSGGGTTVPQIFIDGKSVGGCSELVQLEKNGQLDDLLGRR